MILEDRSHSHFTKRTYTKASAASSLREIRRQLPQPPYQKKLEDSSHSLFTMILEDSCHSLFTHRYLGTAITTSSLREIRGQLPQPPY